MIPCYNAAETVLDAIQSALAQTCDNIEIIVVNDGSTDKSWEILCQHETRSVKIIDQANQGAPAARNKALGFAEGDWCLFLDADDAIEEDFIGTQMQAIKAAGADICFGCNVMTWPDGRRVERPSLKVGASLDSALSQVLSDGWFPANAILWRTAFIRAIGGWDETLRRNEDGELIARALLSDPVLTASHGCRAVYRQHNSPNRVSSRNDWSAVQSSLRVADRIFYKLQTRPAFVQSRKALSHQLSEIASDAFFHGYPDLGNEAETLRRKLGWYKRSGSFTHRFGSALLGPELKARLSRWRARLGQLKHEPKSGQ